MSAKYLKNSLLTIILDGLEALLLSLCFVLVAPLSAIRALMTPSFSARFAIVLMPHALLASYIRAMIDTKLGRHDRAVTTFESLLAQLEEMVFATELSHRQTLVMEHLYSRVARLYLRLGHVDDAALTVIRANKVTATDKLPGILDLDIKTAHIIKAGIAAGRMLSEGTQASLMLHPPVDEASSAKLRRRAPRLIGANSKPAAPTPAKQRRLAKIIPFPDPQKP